MSINRFSDKIVFGMLKHLKHPLMTFKVIVAIHFEAFKLWMKKIKLVKKNIKILNKVTFETNEYK